MPCSNEDAATWLEAEVSVLAATPLSPEPPQAANNTVAHVQVNAAIEKR
ncbi:hypothetical protein [Noviherbaspirillum autotrophicum]|nr:hypothetical protein [Noviherbaspirillum autotrophicum]